MRTTSALSPCGLIDIRRAARKETPSQRIALKRGNLFDDGARPYVTGGKIAWVDDEEVRGWLAKLAERWTPPPGCESEVRLGLSPTGRYVEVTEPEPHKYVPVDSTAKLLTAGRADTTWPDGSLIYVGDFKSGKTHLGRPEDLPQLQGLGLAAADKHGADGMVLGIWYARDGLWDWSPPIALDSPKAAEMWDAVSLYASLGPEPRPGEWCSSCWERKGCAYGE